MGDIDDLFGDNLNDGGTDDLSEDSDELFGNSGDGSDNADITEYGDIPDNGALFNNIGIKKEGKSVNRTAIVMIVVGLGIVVTAISIGLALFKGHSSKSKNEVSSHETKVSSETSTVMSVRDNSTWKDISSNEEVEFNDEYIDLTFTITGIKHVARKNGECVEVKTVLSGSLSGLSGTYELDVPYSKGVKTSIGMGFDVECLLGEFNGAVVVGDIKIK